MHHFASTTPARLTSRATEKLPRWVLVLLCIVYIIPGLIGRSAWKTEDVVGVAQMIEASQALNQFFASPLNSSFSTWRAWFAPEAAQLAIAQEGPLSIWLGAIFVSLFKPILGTIVAARLSNLVWFSLTVSSLWYSVYLLGRLPSAQPLALPFGGQPNPRDYGRMLADAAVLFLLATLGILWRTHESSAEPALLACSAYTFYSLSRCLDNPKQGAIHLGLALSGCFLARGFPGLLPALIATLLLISPRALLSEQRYFIVSISLSLLLVVGSTWIVLAGIANPYWINQWWLWNSHYLGLINRYEISYSIRHFAWFLWPIFPLSLYTLFYWRKHLQAPHIQLALIYVIAATAMVLFSIQTQDAELIAFVIPFSTLSVFALPIMRRSIINAIDWFSVMAFSFILLLLWFSYTTMLTEWPPKIYKNFTRLTTGFTVEFSTLQFILALCASLAWLAIVYWRFKHKPAALWRGSVLSAAGIVCGWLLLMTVFLPASDYAKSYQTLSNDLSRKLKTLPKQCIQGQDVGIAQRASFSVFNEITLHFDDNCPLVLLQLNDNDKDALSPQEIGIILWHGQRASDRHEHFYLIQRSTTDSVFVQSSLNPIF